MITSQRTIRAPRIRFRYEPIGNQRSNADHDEHFSIEVHLWAQVGPDGGRFETLDEIEQTDPNGALPALNAEGIDSVHGQPSGGRAY